MSGLERIDYADGPIALTGWLTRPAGMPRAAVAIYPTIANVNEHMERRARMLAEQGFVAMIADFYGEPVPSFEAAGPLAAKLRATPEGYRARLRAAIIALGAAAPGLPLAAIGYCMGGQAALEAARDGPAWCFPRASTDCSTPCNRPSPERSKPACWFVTAMPIRWSRTTRCSRSGTR